MTREEALERLHDPHRSGWSEETRRAFEQWLESDADLRALDREQQALFAAMDAWPEDAAPAAEFDRKLWARIEAEEARPAWARNLARWLRQPRAAWAACVAAAAVAVMVFAGLERPAAGLEAFAKAALTAEDAEYLRELDRALDDMEMLMDFEAFGPDKI